jgi:chemotaxis protein CheC
MLDEKQIDALKELCNIGSGSAATVLSSFLKRDIRIRVPRILGGKEAADLIGEENRWVLIAHAIGGPIGGRLVVCVRRGDAERMMQVLLGSIPPDWQQDDNAASAIREVSNILTSYFLSVMGQFFKQVLVPGIPELTLGTAEPLLDELAQNQGILVETSFHEKGGETVWYLFVLPEPSAMSNALNHLLEPKS